MTFEQLRTFLWVARLGGFRKASDRLHLSQPAVSTRIANLEDELQAKLFERGPGDLVLTTMGQQLLGYAEQMLFVEEEIKQRVATRQRPKVSCALVHQRRLPKHGCPRSFRPSARNIRASMST